MGRGRLLSLVFGAGGAVAGGSYLFSESLRLGGAAKMEVSGISESINGKDWVKVGGSVGEGIYVEAKGVYRLGGAGHFVGSARIGSGGSNVDGGSSVLANDEQKFMIWAGENGVAILRVKRYFAKEKGPEALEKAKKVNSEIWNKGESSELKDEGGNYFCQERIDNWKNYLSGEVGYVKKSDKTGLGILSVIDNKKLIQKVMTTSCNGTEIIYVEKMSFLNNKGGIEEIDCKTAKIKGKKFNLGKVEAVLYGRNKDLKITERGIEDGNGNSIRWGTTFLPKIELKPV